MCYKIVECIETLSSLMEYGLTFDSNAQNKTKMKAWDVQPYEKQCGEVYSKWGTAKQTTL